MVITWNGEELNVPIESEKMPHHRVSIKKWLEVEDSNEENDSEEYETEESEEEYEEEEINEKQYCYNDLKAIHIKKVLEEQIYDERPKLKKRDFYYQYKETEPERFYIGELTDQQQQEFNQFMKEYFDLFV
jgi:hypothetical protein